jgi:hypothetical protein
MKPDDLIAFLMEEAQHCIINDERSKNLDQALVAQGKKGGEGKPNQNKKGEKDKKSDPDNCEKPGHKKADCWAKGGGKEGQGPKQKKSEKNETATVAVAVADNEKEMFAFSCTSDFANVAEELQVPKSRLGACIDSGASEVYSPD